MPDADAEILQNPERLAKLHSLNLFNHAPDAAFDRLTRFATRLLKAPVSLVTLVDANRQIFKSQVGLSEPWASQLETPLSHSFCQHTVASRTPFIVNDARNHPLVHDNRAIQDLHVLAYAGIPLMTADGFALGSFCVIDHQPREWTSDEIETLNEIALSVITEIELRAEIIENVKSAASLSAADMILTRERNLLRTVLDTIPTGVFMKDTDGHYLFVNSSFADFVNQTIEQLTGADVRDLYGTRGQAYYQEDMDILTSGEARLSVEESHPDPRDPNQVAWYLTSKVPLRDEDGRMHGLLGVVTDITERKRSEAALRASQLQLRAAISNAPLILFTLDPNGIITLIEGRALQSVGMQAGAWAGMSLAEIVKDMPGAPETVQRALMGEALTATAQFGDRMFEVRYSPMLDEDGTLVGTIGVATDITERKQAEAALLASQQHLQAAVMNAPVMFYAIDLDGVYTVCEGKALELFDMEPGERVGKSMYEIFPNGSSVIQRYQWALEGETFSTLVYSENDTYFDTTYSPIRDKRGKVTGAIAVAVDVTERIRAEVALNDRIEQLKTLRRIEAELNATLEVSQVLLFGLDVAARVSGAEHGFIGLVEGDVVRIARPLGQYTGFDAFPVSQGLMQRVMETRQAIWLQDVTQDPAYVPNIPGSVALILLPLLRHGRMIGVMDLETSHAGFFDVNIFEFLKLVAARLAVALENAQLYELSTQQLAELQELYARVSYLERLKTDMIRIAAHDLRNPLTAIMGLTELLLETPDDLLPDHLEFMRDIDKAARQMYKMTGDILSIQRIEQSAQEWKPMDLVATVQSVYEGARSRATRKHQTFELRIPSEPVLIKGDEVQLREAIDNLIGNAIKYTPDGGKVSVRLRPSDGQHVLFEVEDTGYGIPENQQARLFQPFYRAKTPETRQIEGTGLGLHLVKNIIERHAGQLTVQSEYGKGSTFSFVLKTYDASSRPSMSV